MVIILQSPQLRWFYSESLYNTVPGQVKHKGKEQAKVKVMKTIADSCKERKPLLYVYSRINKAGEGVGTRGDKRDEEGLLTTMRKQL